MLVVAAVREPPLHTRLIDRYLVAAEDGGLGSAIVLTKADRPHDEDEIRAVVARYRGVGYPVLSGNAKDSGAGRGGARPDRAAASRCSPDTPASASRPSRGASPASSAPSARSARRSGTGRHTTSDPRLIPLPGGGAVVNTAGVRTFHLAAHGSRAARGGLPRDRPAAARAAASGGAPTTATPGAPWRAAVSAERLDSYRRMLHDMR